MSYDNGFVHLHLHSEYSLLDGACRIEDIPKRAKECGHSAVALTDHGVMYGAVAFYKACKNEGIKPVIGCEVYLAENSRFDKTRTSERNNTHLVLLCKNETGYKNLVKLVSLSFTEGFYSKPRIDMELLREHSEGLICLSACLAGKIPTLLSRGEYSRAVEFALELSRIFGKDNFYIELQNHGLEEQRSILPSLVKLSEECDIPMVATNDCHYLRRKDAESQKVLMCIQMGCTVNDGKSFGFETNEFYYKNTDEMRLLFGRYKGAIENTVRIADMCDLALDFDKIYLPKFPLPQGVGSDGYLASLTKERFELYTNNGKIEFESHDRKEYEQRIEYELSVISGMGYSDYFLIVSDYVNFAKSKQIPTGPGRGSGAGSLVAYLLGITDIDPIVYDLLFERFLNPERVSMPDIDMDFCYNRRGEVIDYVGEKYGSDHVSQIITFGTLGAKAAIRDTGRALGMSYNEVDDIAKAIPREIGITLHDALKNADFLEKYNSSAKNKDLIDTAMLLEGMPRNVSIHAAGIVITDKPITDYVPVSVSNGVTVTQYDMDTIASLGLLKFDFLALRYLTIIRDAELQIRKRTPDFDVENIDLSDKYTYALISKGSTGGVFQLESSGMKQVLASLKPENIDDIIAVIALYRPGPMDSIPRYIECRHDASKIKYDLPELEPILKGTYGCTVYQEQVMQIFREIAGYTYGHADIVRRAMSKKKASVLEAERGSFIKGAEERGIDGEKAEKLFNDMSSFANYAFNKSHAAAYAVIAYRTAYLKTHCPCEYLSALLTSVLGYVPKMQEYIGEAEKRGIKVLPPDINESSTDFSVHISKDNKESIRFGLLALKNVGRGYIDSIIAERNKGPYRSFEEFIERTSGIDMNRKQIESLIKCGAFDSLNVNRAKLLTSYEEVIEKNSQRNYRNVSGQIDMFSLMDEGSADVQASSSFVYPDIPDMSLKEKLILEKEVSGMYFSGHMLDRFSKQIESLKPVNISDLAPDENGDYSVKDKKRIILVGIINSVTKKTTRQNKSIAFFTLEDKSGETECLAFSETFAKSRDLIGVDSAVIIDGEVSLKDENDLKVIVLSVRPLTDNIHYSEKTDTKIASEKKNENNAGTVFLRVPDMNSRQYMLAENLVSIFDDGKTEVVFFDSSKNEYIKTNSCLSFNDYVYSELVKILGDGNVVYKGSAQNTK